MFYYGGWLTYLTSIGHAIVATKPLMAPSRTCQVGRSRRYSGQINWRVDICLRHAQLLGWDVIPTFPNRAVFFSIKPVKLVSIKGLARPKYYCPQRASSVQWTTGAGPSRRGISPASDRPSKQQIQGAKNKKKFMSIMGPKVVTLRTALSSVHNEN